MCGRAKTNFVGTDESVRKHLPGKSLSHPLRPPCNDDNYNGNYTGSVAGKGLEMLSQQEGGVP